MIKSAYLVLPIKEEMYKAQGGAADPSQQAGGNAGESGKANDVTDVDFEEVK